MGAGLRTYSVCDMEEIGKGFIKLAMYIKFISQIHQTPNVSAFLMSRVCIKVFAEGTFNASGKDILIDHDPNHKVGEILEEFTDEDTGATYVCALVDDGVPLTSVKTWREVGMMAEVLVEIIQIRERRFMKAFDHVHECQRQLAYANRREDRAQIVEWECLLEEAEKTLKKIKKKYPETYPGQWDNWIHANGYWSFNFRSFIPDESQRRTHFPRRDYPVRTPSKWGPSYDVKRKSRKYLLGGSSCHFQRFSAPKTSHTNKR